eukprot:5633757-Pyramimonas_sp.AAC.2
MQPEFATPLITMPKALLAHKRSSQRTSEERGMDTSLNLFGCILGAVLRPPWNAVRSFGGLQVL